MKGITRNPALDAYQRMSIGAVGANRAAQSTQAQAPASKPSEEAARVTISGAARDLAAGAQSSGIDQKKVDGLKDQIAIGAFQVRPTAVAEGMIGASL